MPTPLLLLGLCQLDTDDVTQQSMNRRTHRTDCRSGTEPISKISNARTVGGKDRSIYVDLAELA